MTEYTEEQALAATWSLGVGKLSRKNNIVIFQYPKKPIIISEKSSELFLERTDHYFSYGKLVRELIKNHEPVEANMVMTAANIILT